MIDNLFDEFRFIIEKVFKKFLNLDLSNSDIIDIIKPVKLKDISVIINVIGKSRGIITITLDKSTEESLIRFFCLNNKISAEKVKEKNIYVIGELVNMILGNFFCEFNNQEETVTISSPNFITGRAAYYFSNPIHAKLMKLFFDNSEIDIILEFAGYKSVLFS